MGNETSKDFRDNSLISNNCSSDYDGLKTGEESSIEDEYIPNDKSEILFTLDKKEKNTSQAIQDKVPVTFEWNKEGNAIYVTGDFCNWQQFFLMEKKSNDKFCLTLNLTKGLIQYKFKVDNQWKCNENFPMINDDKGNVNNYIDTTNWEISIENSETNTNTYSNNELSSKHKYNKSFNNQNHYSTYIPKISEMNDFPPKVPVSYKSKLNVKKGKRKNSIGIINNLPQREKDTFGGNYKPLDEIIKKVKHEEINHLSYELKNEKSVKSSIISRYRLKFTNFVYYK